MPSNILNHERLHQNGLNMKMSIWFGADLNNLNLKSTIWTLPGRESSNCEARYYLCATRALCYKYLTTIAMKFGLGVNFEQLEFVDFLLVRIFQIKFNLKKKINIPYTTSQTPVGVNTCVVLGVRKAPENSGQNKQCLGKQPHTFTWRYFYR